MDRIRYFQLMDGLDGNTPIRQYLKLDYLLQLLESGSYYVKRKRKFEDKRECWKKICNYFTKKNKNFKIGTLIEKKLNGKIFSDDFIEKLYNLGENELNKLSSNYYKDIDKTTEIFINIVKDILENIGLSNEKTILIGQKYLILKARLKVKMDKLKKMNEINKKIKK